jgi:hypothetical protein
MCGDFVQDWLVDHVVQEVLPLTAYHAMANRLNTGNDADRDLSISPLDMTIPASAFHPAVLRLSVHVAPGLTTLPPAQHLRCFPSDRLVFESIVAGSSHTHVVKVRKKCACFVFPRSLTHMVL